MTIENKKSWQIIVVDQDRCTGCEICESVCSMSHYDVFNPKFSRIHRVRVEPILNSSLACLRCVNPDCVDACEVDALSQNPETGTIEVNSDLCDGCGACVRSCPFGAMTIQIDTEKSISCDLCESTDFDVPQCVRYCPKSAIYLRDVDSELDEDRVVTLSKIFQDGFPQPEDGEFNNMRDEYREFTK